jgi:Fe-S cluster biogenesis protein NfuA
MRLPELWLSRGSVAARPSLRPVDRSWSSNIAPVCACSTARDLGDTVRYLTHFLSNPCPLVTPSSALTLPASHLPPSLPVAAASPVLAAATTDQTLELTEENVEIVLDEVRPYLMADGGNVELADIDGPVVYLRLQGACGSCPSSMTTMTMGIKRRLMEKIPVRWKD